MNLTTIAQLDRWMTENCYNNSYGIGSRMITVGYGLNKFENKFVWYYMERGQRQDLQYFKTEKEAVAFAFERITSDKNSKLHLVCSISDKKLEFELLRELENRKVNYSTDRSSKYGTQDTSYQVFVSGCDINRVMDLRNKYGLAF
jgi:hypothetical protein